MPSARLRGTTSKTASPALSNVDFKPILATTCCPSTATALNYEEWHDNNDGFCSVQTWP